MVAERIRMLREQNNLTQTALAKKLNITRSSVNAWELGISVPSTQIIISLAEIFNVSTDYLLGLKQHSSIDVSGLSEEDISLIYNIIDHLKKK